MVFEIQIFWELTKSPAMSLERVLREMRFRFSLTKILQSRPQEDRDMYWRGEALSKTPRSCHDDFIYFKRVNSCVTEMVNKEITAIGRGKPQQFLKLCETLGFPAQCCNPDDLEKSFMDLIDYICHLSNELMTSTQASQQFEDAFKKYTVVWDIFDQVDARQVFVVFFQGVKKFELFEQKFKSILGVGSTVYQVMELRASMTYFQPETDTDKLAAILTGILDRFERILGIWPDFKIGCLAVIVPELDSFLKNPRSKHLSENIQQMVAEVVKFMFEFGKEVVRQDDFGYEYDLRVYHCSILPKSRADLTQFLLGKLGN